MNKIARERNHLFVAAVQHDIHTFVCVSAHIRKVQLNLRHFTWSSKKKQRVKKTRFLSQKMPNTFHRASVDANWKRAWQWIVLQTLKMNSELLRIWMNSLTRSDRLLFTLSLLFHTSHNSKWFQMCFNKNHFHWARNDDTLHLSGFFSPFFCLLFCLPQNLSDHIAAKCRVKATPLACVCVWESVISINENRVCVRVCVI